MQYITDSKTLRKVFARLCGQYNHYMWSIAWAGMIKDFVLAKVLERNSNKIEKLVVGLHFYQTSPSFIEKFMEEKGVRFAMQSNGTFHPKVYLFYNSKKDWSAIVGSSNFTESGFGNNCEANILFSNEDDNQSLFVQMCNSISEWWKSADKFDRNKLQAYKHNFEIQSKNIKKLKRFKENKIVSDMELNNWNEYYMLIKQDGNLGERFKLLDLAQYRFKNDNSFRYFNTIERKGFAGMLRDRDSEEEPTWECFGTIADGKYKHLINDLSSKLGNAIDLIPFSGSVSKKQYNAYLKCFEGIGRKNPLACVSRLLAIKRPDLFICINQENKKKLSAIFNVSQSQITIDNYWSLLENHIWTSDWYLEPRGSKKEKELKCWKYRVALLDCISYK